MSKVQVDDSNSNFVAYSGSWQTSRDSRQISSSSHFTTSVGATATISFTGTLIRVICTNPAVPDGVIKAEFIVDGVVTPFTRTSHSNAFYNDHFFTARNLQANRQHTLVVRNTGTQVPFHLDLFEIEGGNPVAIASTPPENVGASPPPPSIPPAQPTPVITSTRTVVQTAVSVSTSVEVVTTTSDRLTPRSSSIGSSSGTPSVQQTLLTTGSSASSLASAQERPVGSTALNAGVTVTAVVFTTSIPGAAQTSIGEGDPARTSGSGSSMPLSIGAIIGIILGSLFLITALGIITVLLIRARRKIETRRELARQRMSGYNIAAVSRHDGSANGHTNDVEAQSSEESVQPPPRLSLGFAQTIHEKSRPLTSTLAGEFSLPPPFNTPSAGDSSNAPSPVVSAPATYLSPSFRSSYPLSLSEVAPPAYSSARQSTLYSGETQGDQR